MDSHLAIITVPANDLVGQIHDRMPLILPKSAYERWLGAAPDPSDLLNGGTHGDVAGFDAGE